jgi:hypothetical protein
MNGYVEKSTVYGTHPNSGTTLRHSGLLPEYHIDLIDQQKVRALCVSVMKDIASQNGEAVIRKLTLGFDFDVFELSATYVAKATLNHIRQMNDYSDAYRKYNESGVEDNVMLESAVTTFLNNESLTLQDVVATVVTDVTRFLEEG